MLWGFATSLVLLFAFALHNWRRAKTEIVQELIPNCLLTTYPLLFIPGKRSLFYFLGYWNQIPHWLASHGYEVFHLQLPWKNQKARSQVLAQFLKRHSEQSQKFHLFLDGSSLEEVQYLLEREDYDCLASITLIGPPASDDNRLSPRRSIPIEDIQIPLMNQTRPLFWSLHLLWTQQKLSLNQLGWKLNRRQGEFLLQRTQFLAERDLLQKQRSPNLKT